MIQGVSEIDPTRRNLILRPARVAGWCLVVTSVSAGIGCWRSHNADRAQLRKIALAVVDSRTSSSEQVLALLHWVHQIRGTARNGKFFGFRSLGATAAQVLEGGGDCADKSRLLTSLLREVEIPASMAMCFDARTGLPVHTVVEARIGPTNYLLVDPAFDLFFPRPGGSGYYDLLDLRRDPTILARRVADLRSQLQPGTRSLPFYLRPSASYETASTINWRRNSVLSWVCDRLRPWYGNAVYRLPRPLLLEEPKLLLATVGILSGTLAAIPLGLWARPRGARVSVRRQMHVSRPRVAIQATDPTG